MGGERGCGLLVTSVSQLGMQTGSRLKIYQLCHYDLYSLCVCFVSFKKFIKKNKSRKETESDVSNIVDEGAPGPPFPTETLR